VAQKINKHNGYDREAEYLHPYGKDLSSTIATARRTSTTRFKPRENTAAIKHIITAPINITFILTPGLFSLSLENIIESIDKTEGDKWQ